MGCLGQPRWAEYALLRGHCLAHGQRKFRELEEVFPQESAVVTHRLKQVFEHEAEAQAQRLSAEARLASPHTSSGPLLDEFKVWLERHGHERTVEPKSRLGKAMAYLLKQWEALTGFLTVPGAPLDNNTADRTLKLCIRQRKNSLFYATEHRAYIASLLTGVIATCRQAGVKALEYRVAVQTHRQAVFADPAAWLPWTYHTALGLG